MKTNNNAQHELIADLESAYQKVFEKELRLKEHGHRDGNGIARYQTMSDIRSSEERYRRLFETAQDGILILNGESGAITDANPYIIDRLGYSLKELIGKRLWEIGAFADVKESKSAFEELQLKEYIRYKDLPLKTKNGENREVEFVSNAYMVSGEKVIQCNIRDVTEHRLVEHTSRQMGVSLRESEERYRRLFETAQDGILILDAETGSITDANPYIIESLGYSLEEMIGKRLWEIGAFADVKESKAAFEELQKKEYIRYNDLPLKTKSGESRAVEFVSNVYIVSDKKVIQCNIRDITERKHAEELSRTNLDKFKNLVETIPDGFYRSTPEGRFVDVNPALVAMLGYDSKEELQRIDITSELYFQIADRSIKKYNPEFTELPEEYRMRRKDGTAIWVEDRCRYIRDEAGNIQYHEGICRDISERKKNESTIRESEKRFKALFDQAPIAIALIDLEGRPFVSNNTLTKMTGYSKHELSQMKFAEFTYREDIDKDVNKFNELIGGKISSYNMEKRFVHKNGNLVWVNLYVTILRDDLGRQQEIIGMAEDISERKLVEIALEDSNEKFHQLADNITDTFWIRSPDMSEVHYVSPAFETIWGRTIASLQAHPSSWADFIYPDDRERVLASFDSLNCGVPNIDIEYRITRPNGEIRWIHVRGFQIRNTANIVIRHLGIVSDITERKQAEKQIALLAHTLKSVTECVSITDVNDIILFVNDAFVKTYGYRENELLGKNISMVRSPNNPPEVTQGILAATMAGGWHGELLNRGSDGHEFPVSLSTSYVRNEIGAIVGLVGIATDITEKRKNLQDVMQSQKIQSIGTLAGGIAHDFNNILGIILGYTGLLNRGAITAKRQAESIAAINQAVQRGASLVKQILTFARKTDVESEPVNIFELICELVPMLQQTFPKTITFRNTIPYDIPQILADRSQIHQAILNLCVNARDAMPKGGSIGIHAEIVSAEHMSELYPDSKSGTNICISVIDTGEGMNEKTRSRIFDPFFTTKEQGKGTGLGLSVVFGIVQAHQGFISVQSELDKGTTFKLYFPILTSSEIPAVEKLNVPYETGGTETILVVEDEELLLDMISMALQAKGYTIIAARDGAEAVALYQKHQDTIAMVITDLGLPVLSGHEEFYKLKKINSLVKIIFASGYFDPKIKSNLVDAGARHFIQKPYVIDELLKMIREVLDSQKI